MTLEAFFGKFDLFADAPDAVAQMRELVLHFAVTGRLSERKTGDGTASELVEALAAASVRHRKNGRRAAAGPLSEVVDERPVDAPAHWAWIPLKEIGAISGGMTPTKDKSAFWNGDVNWFSSKDIKTDELTDSELKITREATEATNLQIYSPGALIMVARSGILKRTFPVSILRVHGTVNQDLKVLSPFIDGLERYLQIMLRGMTGFIVTSLVKTGMTVQSLKYEEFEAQPFPLPPLAEQKRIVEKVDELMALCDRLEAQQQERETRHAALARASLARFAEAPTPANLDWIFHSAFSIPPSDLRKSILTLAVQGKLVPQDPNDEPADEVLARIAATKLQLRENGEIARQKPFEPLQSDSVPFEAPESWRWAKLAELTELITKGSSPKWQGISYVSESDGILFITSENVGNYVLRKLDNLKYVSKEFNDIEPRSILKQGDILMNLVGASIGRTALYDLHDGANINQAVALIRLVRETEGVCSRFLLHYLNSPSAIDYMLSSRVVNAQPNISLTDAREFAVPVPPLAEQRRIVAKVDELMALVDALETHLATARTTAANLLAAAVARITHGNEVDAAAEV